MPDRLLLSSYVPPQEWAHPSADIVALGLEGAQEIIDRWSPFNKRESSVMHMRDVTSQKYPIIFIIILLHIPGMNLAKLGFFQEN